MFKLKLYDRNGVELHEGDIVRISNSGLFNFFAEVKYLEAENAIAPFHTFVFASVEKIDAVPEGATKAREDRYNVWYVADGEAAVDEQAKENNDYLWSWRELEHQIDARCWRIEREEKPELNVE